MRIICTNQTGKGCKTVIIATNGVNSVLDNITAVFGPKQRSELLQMTSPVELDAKMVLEELEPNFSSDNLQEIDLSRFNIDGWISSCNHGSGRSSKDRQFIYINSRPCEPKKILKTINEMYHRYNSNQSPFVYLNIIVQRSDVDVNITPDKRQLMLNNENVLLLVLKTCLSKTFGNVPSTFKMQNLDLSSNKSETISEMDTIPNSKAFSQMLSQWKLTGRTDNPSTSDKVIKRKVTNDVDCKNMKMRKIQEFLSQNNDNTAPLSDDETLPTTMDETMDQSMDDNNHTKDTDSPSNYSNLSEPETNSIPEQHKIKIEKSVCNSLLKYYSL